MSQVYFKNGLVLFRDNAVAMDQDCCCGPSTPCPIQFLHQCCHLYWYIKPGGEPEEPYTVKIITPSSVEYYENVSSGVFVLAETGTYYGSIEKDAIETNACEITITSCESDPGCPCCARISNVNIKTTRSATSFKARGSLLHSPIGWAGYYMEGNIPNINFEEVRIGTMTSGSKEFYNCYDRYVNEFDEVTHILALGSDHVDYYSHIDGYRDGTLPPCSVPVDDYYYQRIYYDYYISFNGLSFRIGTTRTGEDFNFVGYPISGVYEFPPVPTIPSTVWLTDSIPVEACPSPEELVRIFVLNMHSLSTIPAQFGAALLVGGYCEGTNEIVVEQWPDVIPL